jgi:hypothetical protein
LRTVGVWQSEIVSDLVGHEPEVLHAADRSHRESRHDDKIVIPPGESAASRSRAGAMAKDYQKGMPLSCGLIKQVTRRGPLWIAIAGEVVNVTVVEHCELAVIGEANVGGAEHLVHSRKPLLNLGCCDRCSTGARCRVTRLERRDRHKIVRSALRGSMECLNMIIGQVSCAPVLGCQ